MLKQTMFQEQDESSGSDTVMSILSDKKPGAVVRHNYKKILENGKSRTTQQWYQDLQNSSSQTQKPVKIKANNIDSVKQQKSCRNNTETSANRVQNLSPTKVVKYERRLSSKNGMVNKLP